MDSTPLEQPLAGTGNLHERLWKPLQVYLTKPHVINKRIAAIVHIGTVSVPAELATADCVAELESQTVSAIRASSIRIRGETLHIRDNGLEAVQTICECQETDKRVILVNKLLSKNTKCDYCYEFVVIDFSLKSATFICIAEPGATVLSSAAKPPYTITLQHEEIVILSADESTKTAQWLQNSLLPKLKSWSAPASTTEGNKQRCIASHSLLNDAEEYVKLYNELKQKYGIEMVAKWPEQTDASKFVYEDVAIATYLLILWRQERRDNSTDQLQSFVDLGCGNGLLVYLLSSEGHRGYGIDLRKRGVWELYPETTVLRVEAIVPSDKYLFPDIDWIIGNHSDELSPWVPVIAARSAFTTRYFLLPCCAYEFSGSKFQRRHANDSQYFDYITYLETISERCGFVTQVDRMKIPSTKRVCLVGSRRRGVVGDFERSCAAIQETINNENQTTCVDPQESWCTAFRPREAVERVRNCSTLDDSLKSAVVQTVVAHLLQKRRYLDGVSVKWNIGGQCPIEDLVKLLQPEQLKQMKSEFGGLQTLLKNHNQIFLVQKGLVQLRSPVAHNEHMVQKKRNKAQQEATKKLRKCWFHLNHPDGCPLADTECTFVHANNRHD